MSKQSVAVRIAGHNYKILSDGDPDSLQQVARYVDLAMNRVRERTGTVDTLDISVLTCINLAREIIALREQKDETVEDNRMRSLIERIETVVAGVPSSSTAAVHAEAEGAEGAEVAAAKGGQPVSAHDSEGVESARTLDLPSVESLRDRTSAASGASGKEAAEESMPEARAASSGRERAS